MAFDLNDLAPTLTVDIGADDEQQTLLAYPRVFSSGSDGYYLTGKVMLGGNTFQVTLSAVRVGSKGAHPEEAKALSIAKAQKEQETLDKMRARIAAADSRNGAVVRVKK